MSGDSRAVDRFGRVGKVVKADAAVAKICDRSTGTAGKGGSPTTRVGPESTELGLVVGRTALEHSSAAFARSGPSADLLGTNVDARIPRDGAEAGLARLGVETTRPRAARSKIKLIPSYDGRHGLRGPKEGGRPSARSRASGRRAANAVQPDQGGKGVNAHSGRCEVNPHQDTADIDVYEIF